MFSLPKIIAEYNSEISGPVKVIEEGKERRLIVGGFNQSVSHNTPDVESRVWGKIAELQKTAQGRISNCLLLGLGGGTEAHLLNQQFPGIKIDAVELDPIIVEAAYKYFGLDKLSNLKTITGDAVEILKNPTELRDVNYDRVIVDIYCGGSYPKTAESDKFLTHLVNLTRPGGQITFNRISTEKNDMFESKLNAHFGNFKKFTVRSKFGGENILYVCDREKNLN